MSSGKYEPLADQYLTVKVRGSSEFMCQCPFCEGGASLQFNIDSGLWVCFKCDAKGNAKRLVTKLGATYLDPVVSVEHIRAHMDRLKIRKKKEQQGEPVLDDRILSRYFDDPEYWHDSRGLSYKTIERFGLAYDPITDRHIIPHRNARGELVGVVQRRRTDEFPRYLYPDGFNRRGSLFGAWLVEGRKKIALVEGSTDTLAMYDSKIIAPAQWGSSISKEQVRLLHRLGVREAVLFYDYDEAGKKAEEKSREYIDGIILRAPVWDESKYCWHKKLCGCGEHTWRDIGKCNHKRLCQCGRKHEMDPGSLRDKERRAMYESAPIVGKRTWKYKKTAR
jgi:DNA primase